MGSRVAVAGDWHANIQWIEKAVSSIASDAPDIRTILHLGDFGFSAGARGRRYLESVDGWCQEAGIEILVTPGNHEEWDLLDSEFEAAGGMPVQMSATVTALPRGYRFSLGGASFLSFGGAASVDYQQRRAGLDWFLTERPTDEDVARAISDGPVDVLLMHETVNGGTEASERQLRTNPIRWPAEALYYSAQSRARATQVWSAVEPRITLHGHMHVADERTYDDGRRVISLGRDTQEHNLGILDLRDLSWSWLAGPGGERPGRLVDWDKQYLERPDDQ